MSSSVRSRLAGVRLIGTDQVGEGAAFPAQQQLGVGVGVVAIHGDVDLVEQAAQQPFSVFVGGGRRRPYAGEIITECEDR